MRRRILLLTASIDVPDGMEEWELTRAVLDGHLNLSGIYENEYPDLDRYPKISTVTIL